MPSANVNAPCVAGRFVLESIAGEGGMGTVYRARDPTTGQTVAVKLLAARGRLHESARFDREARILAALEHPGIVRYLDHGTTDAGELYIAMEWLDGEDLAARLARGALSLEESLTLIRRVAAALAAVHARGLVHRDLKPSNIFLREGRVERATLLDFGVARSAEPSQALTRTGAVIGTLAYMAPEQARGERDVNAAADVFSLGCVLFECLTGQPAFAAPHQMAALVKVLFEEPPRLRELRPEVPEPLDALLASMLAKARDRRPADARAVLEALAAEGLEGALHAGLAGTPARLTADEQQLVSVLMAAFPRRETERSLDATIDEEPLLELRRELAAHGAELEVLADGSLVAMFGRGRGTATDQAVQAARCARALKARFPEGTVAVATGLGRLTGRLIAGEVLDRAAALLHDLPASAATTAPILLDEATRGLLETRYRIERTAEGGYTLSSEELEVDASRPLLGKPTPCVGRDVELGMLESVLAACIEESEPRAALVTAPAGAGKSRLVHELLRRVAARSEEVLVLLGRGDPLSAGSSYGLLGKALRRLAGIADGEDLATRRKKLAQRIAERVPDEESGRVVAFVGELSGVPFPDEDDAPLRAARQDPQLMSDQVTRAALDLLRAEAAARPVLLLLEDLHWGDAPTVKLCARALRELKGAPLLVLGLARPEVHELFPRLWEDAAQVVPLRPLSPKAGARLAAQVLGAEVPPEVVARVVEQSQGNALFLEELIRAAAEGRGEEAPETVLAMLQARIGRLPAETRRALRAASVFGERAWVGGIRALLGGSPWSQEIEEGIRRSIRDEILEERRESRFPGEQELRFRHALMRDAAYGLLTEEDRATAHRLAGEYLEARGEPDALVLAEHFAQGREEARAIPYFLQAAEQAYEASAMEATLASVMRAIGCGAAGEQRGALLSLQIAVFVGRNRYAEVLALGAEAIALLERGSRRWCRALEQLILAAFMAQQLPLAAELAARFMAVEPNADARGEYVRVASVATVQRLLTGDKPVARSFLWRTREVGAALDTRDRGAWAYWQTAEAHDLDLSKAAPWSCMLRYAEAKEAFRAAGILRFYGVMSALHGKALDDLGDHAAAEAILRESLAQSARLNESFTLGYAKVYLARFLARSVPLDRVEEPSRLASEVIAAENRMLIGLAHGALAQIKWRQGDLTGAEEDARAACMAGSAFPSWSWDLTALRIMLLLALERTSEALTCGEEAIAHLERLGLAGHGELPLRLALVEARNAGGQEREARRDLEKAVSGLRLRLADIPEEEARNRYLTCVPTNARIAALAREWLGVDPRPGAAPKTS